MTGTGTKPYVGWTEDRDGSVSASPRGAVRGEGRWMGLLEPGGQFEEGCKEWCSSNDGMASGSPRTGAVRGEVSGEVLLEPGCSRRRFDEVFSLNRGGSWRGVRGGSP
mgnify:CR=1 FL=1